MGGDPVHIDAFDPASAAARSRFAKALREKVPALNADDIDAELLRLADAPDTDQQNDECGAKPAEDDPVARREAEALLADPRLLTTILDDIAVLGVAGERELTATVFLTGVSRLLDAPLAVIVQGPSSSGKSYVVSKVAKLFPPEAIVLAHQMTPQALFHMPPGSLTHRFVVAGERSRLENDDRAEATRALREMLSSGRLSRLMPVKSGGTIETVLIEQEGPIAFAETTTLTNIFEEDANRCLLLNTDEQIEQTERVIRSLARGYGGAGVEPETREALHRKHHALQRLLEPVRVVIPFAEELGAKFATRRVEARRAFPQVAHLMMAVTLLHQRQRERDAGGNLVATPEDYQLARHLLVKPLSRHEGGLSEGARRFGDTLRKEAGIGRVFTTREAKAWEGAARSSVHGWLGELHDAGLLDLVEQGKGRTPSTWKLVAVGDDGLGQVILPPAEELFAPVSLGHTNTICK